MDFNETRSSLSNANPNVLRAVLYTLTGNKELLAMKTIKYERRGGAFIEHQLSDKDAQTVIELMTEYLVSKNTKGGSSELDHQDFHPDWVKDAIGFIYGYEPSASEFKLGLRELKFEDLVGAQNSHAQWSKKVDAKDWKVLIVGSGFSGVGMAVRLQELGIPYSIVDKQKRIGGTWERNQFPESRVDTTSFVYQYSFVEKYPWTEHYASQSEVRQYLENAANSFGISPNIRFQTEVVSGNFSDETNMWKVSLKNEAGEIWEEQYNFVVSASGLFSTPKIPNFEGLDSFPGEIIHSAAWQQDFDPSGKKVGIIGNGSTGVQILPWLAKNASEVRVFQRTPQWISPLEKYKEKVSDNTNWLHENVPYYWRWSCFNARLIRGTLGDAQEYDRAWQASGGKISRRNDGLRENLTEYIHSKLGDHPELLQSCVPNYAPLARRLVVDNGWYDAILKDNVSLIPSGISSINGSTVTSSDGHQYDCDALIMATGFDAEKYTLPAEYFNGDGKTVSEVWEKDGPRAYVGIEVPGFKNFFMMYGPNGQPRGGSLVGALELWVDYIAKNIVAVIENGYGSSSVTEATFEKYNQLMDEELRLLIWQEEAPKDRNYYVNKFGRQNVNMPWRMHDYAQILRVDVKDTHEFYK